MDASRFGQVTVLFNRDLFPDNANELSPRILRRAVEKLSGYDPARDFLCLAGSPLISSFCIYALGILGKRPIRVLRWDKMEGSYYPVTIGLMQAEPYAEPLTEEFEPSWR